MPIETGSYRDGMHVDASYLAVVDSGFIDAVSPASCFAFLEVVERVSGRWMWCINVRRVVGNGAMC